MNPDLRLENVICTMLCYPAGSEAQLLASRPGFWSGAPSLALGANSFISRSLGFLVSEMGLIILIQMVVRKSIRSQDDTLKSPRTEPVVHYFKSLMHWFSH